jgi:pyroglutamyl-peptidase
MTRILITAFQPYDGWPTNASWLALMELARELPEQPRISTRLYPVDFATALDRLEADLNQHYDYAVLTGQAPGRTRIELEAVALNLASPHERDSSLVSPIVEEGPLAYSSNLPADELCRVIRQAGIPAAVSHHGGTYLCNALLYSALHQIQTRKLKTRAIFVHLPVDTLQAARHDAPIPSLPTTLCVQALRLLLQALPPIQVQA